MPRRFRIASDFVDVFQNHQRWRVRCRSVEHVVELTGAVFASELEAESTNGRVAGHDAGDGRLSVARRPIEEVTAPVREIVASEPLFPLEKRLEIVPDESVQAGVQDYGIQAVSFSRQQDVV